MFESAVANDELSSLLDNEDWIPDEWDMRRFRSFHADPELIVKAQKRIDDAERR